MIWVLTPFSTIFHYYQRPVHLIYFSCISSTRTPHINHFRQLATFLYGLISALVKGNWSSLQWILSTIGKNEWPSYIWYQKLMSICIYLLRIVVRCLLVLTLTPLTHTAAFLCICRRRFFKKQFNKRMYSITVFWFI